MRVALIRLDHELNAKTDERSGPGLERDGERRFLARQVILSAGGVVLVLRRLLPCIACPAGRAP